TDAHMALASAQSRHAQQLQAAENLGYERGIKDYGKVEAERDKLHQLYLSEWQENEALLAKAGVDFTPDQDGGKPIATAIQEIVSERDAALSQVAEMKKK